MLDIIAWIIIGVVAVAFVGAWIFAIMDDEEMRAIACFIAVVVVILWAIWRVMT